MNIKSEYFICENCNQRFPKGRPDKETECEKNSLFPNLKKSDEVLVCETCFIEIMDFNEPGEFRYIEFVEKN